MTRYFVLFCFLLAPILQASFLPLSSTDAPSASSELFGSSDLAAGLALSEISDPAASFLLALPSASLEELAFREMNSDAANPGAPVFLLSVIGLPQPAEAEMSLVESSAPYTVPQDPWNMWLVLGAASMLIALVGAIRFLLGRRISAGGRKRYPSSGTSSFAARNAL
jgi:hypothetical protein